MRARSKRTYSSCRKSSGSAQAKDFSTADELRKEIELRGYEVKDNRDGTATYQRRT